MRETTNIDWQPIGEELEKFIALGFFPGIGYDANGWEAWVYFDRQTEGETGHSVKAVGESLVEAIEKVKQAVRERVTDRMIYDPEGG